ncbi:putative bifunctional cytochrome P450 E-class, group I:NADPH-P450 reductase [Triangularia verruculosa]|uniref:Bifunctional cytochrome P450/NADPH--P450 reductase n=1 Tax=Triangularia verruculosa TaxID=2587418 RepID=A0AAN6XLZ9_9PEZI|nr:putative bifunctional cytochrome P450 E-class, group I:NADPH-P450 reductase [Triangularia verruculosa]
MAVGGIPLPGPRAYPLVGNVLQFDSSSTLTSIENFIDQYGEAFRLILPWGVTAVISSAALVHELSDETRFKKPIIADLEQIRNGVPAGMFTARTEEPIWGIAHRVLTPAFGPVPIQAMFPEMHELAAQLAMKWARHGPQQSIAVSEDFTRLALDTIALCSMDFRFNSYYHDELHPFITAMSNFLIESGNRAIKGNFLSNLLFWSSNRYFADIKTLRTTAQAILDARRANPNGRQDLLSAMLDGVDRKTGEKLDDGAIIDNLITFLIAGHETTSGMLSFAFVMLLKNPETLRKAQQEVDQVIGRGPITVEHMKKLPYVTAVLRETLRLCPTIPSLGVQALEDTVIGGKWAVSKGTVMLLFLARSHRDKAVYGETADDFIPERMLDENFERLSKEHPGFWKPFGNGQRGCIGRAFAWQEAMIIMAMLLQNFDFEMTDPSYKLKIKETLTTKPDGFEMKAKLRHGLTPTELERQLNGGLLEKSAHSKRVNANAGEGGTQLKPLHIYYGSNTGTCEALAQRLAMDAPSHGYTATIIDALDAAANKLPRDDTTPVTFITASYEGEPPDNATEFVAWIKALSDTSAFKGTPYAVFGCGHHDWANTFHRVPRLIHDTLEQKGATPLCDLGLTDVAQGEMFADFEQWEDDVFWPAVQAKYGSVASEDRPQTLEVQLSTPRASTLRQDVKEALVLEEKTLTRDDGVLKKHLEVQLPDGMTYRAGDYLAVLPVNPKESVDRVMRKFGLAWDSHVTVAGGVESKKIALPTGVPVPVHEVLGSYVELLQPVTKRGIQTLSNFTSSTADRETLLALSTNAELYSSTIIASRLSLIDMLDQYPSISLPFGTFLSLLPPMRVRQYSISSSPLESPFKATLTYTLLSGQSWANPANLFAGVATSFLSALKQRDRLLVSVRQSHSSFHLPPDPATPMIMVAAGAGIAPFRGFIQERATLLSQGATLGKALLFFGCRHPEWDDLYREELDKWEKDGVVEVVRAYSRYKDNRKYVGVSISRHTDEVKRFWEKGARIYVCGSRSMADGAKAAVGRAVIGDEAIDEEIAKWFEGVRNVRYAVDVFD